MTSYAFNFFIRKVITYCQPDRLIELEIDVCYTQDLDMDHKLLQEVIPYFRRLEQLTLRVNSKSIKRIDNLFTHIHLPNLKCITFENCQLNKNWLTLFPNEQPNLTELRLYNVELSESLNKFAQFLDRFPNLEVFIHTGGSLKFHEIADVLLEKIPNLRGFGFNTLETDDKIGFVFDESMSFLHKFQNLQELHLESEKACKNFHSIFQYVPNIKEIVIWQLKLQRLPVEIRRIFNAIKKIIETRRENSGNTNRMHFIVNRLQYNEFLVIQNVHNYIRLTLRWRPYVCVQK